MARERSDSDTAIRIKDIATDIFESRIMHERMSRQRHINRLWWAYGVLFGVIVTAAGTGFHFAMDDHAVLKTNSSKIIEGERRDEQLLNQLNRMEDKIDALRTVIIARTP